MDQPKTMHALSGAGFDLADPTGSTLPALSASATPSTLPIANGARSPLMPSPTGPSSGSATTASGPAASARKLSDSHKKRLMERALDPTLCEQLGVWSPDAKTIAFDYRVGAKVHNTKLRRGKGDMPWSAPGKELALWNFDCLRADPEPDEFVIITEGEFDGIASIQCGFVRVVSVPNGAQKGSADNPKAGFQYLYRGEQLHPDIDKFKEFVIATDGDSKGLACRDALAVRLGDERCRHAVWPDGCKDANDVLLLKGPQALQDLIHAARPMWTDEIATIDDIPEPPEEVRYRIGIPELDNHGFRVTLPALWVLLGPYSSGKSVLLRQVLCGLYGLYGWRILLTSFEERVKPRYQRDLRRHFIERASTPDHPWTEAEIAAADAKIQDAFVFLRRARGKPLDSERLLDRIEYSAKVYGTRVVAIDPANEIKFSVERGQLKTDMLGDFMMSLKDLAEDYGLLVMLLGHTSPGKTEKKLQQRSLLTLYDGEDTRHWGGKSDIGWVMWRTREGPSWLHMERTKDHETMGKPTLAKLELDRALGRFRVQGLGYDLRPEGKGGADGREETAE